MVKSVSGVLVRHLESMTAASGRLLSFRLPNHGDSVPSGVLGVCFPSLCHHRFRTPLFVQATEPWRFSIFWIRSACTPLLPWPIPSASIHSGCRIVVIL